MSDSDRLERLSQRAKREKTARLEAEKIASEKLEQANEAKRMLQRQLFDLNDLTASLTEELDRVQARERASNHDVLWQIGNDLNGASLNKAGEAIFSAIESLGLACGARGVGIWEIDASSLELRLVHNWRPLLSSQPRLPSAGPGSIRRDYVERLASLDATGAVIKSSLNEALVDVDAFFDGEDGDSKDRDDVSIHAGVFAKVDGTLRIAAVTAAGSGYDMDRSVNYLLRGLMILLAQFLRRIDAEAELRTSSERRMSDHGSLMKSAAALMAASPENFDELLLKALTETAELLEFPAISDWYIDYPNQMYVRTRMWLHESLTPREVRTKVPFGTHDLLDSARLTKTLAKSDQPILELRKQLAMPRGDPDHPSAIIVAGSVETAVWDGGNVEALQRMSATISLVENRLVVESRASAVLDSSPIPIVLRSQEDLRILDCNGAFVSMLGMPSVDSLLGTKPDKVLFESLADVAQEFRTSSAWMFNETTNTAIETSDGGTSQIQVYRGPQGRPILAQIRCVGVEPVKDESFILVHALDITERRKAARRLEFLAEHDELTGLLNRRGLRREFADMQSDSGSSALVVMDLDRFKYVNDSLGHATGNTVLRRIADRCATHIRPGDVVARLGGDEFAIAFKGPISDAETRKLVHELIESVGSVMVLGRHRHYPSLSAGIAYSTIDSDIEGVFLEADAAMYKAKGAGGRRLAVFDKGMKEEIHFRMRMEGELRHALARGEFCVHYQPEVSMPSGEIVGAEALVRWRHPERGLLAAGQFIEEAEEIGLIAEIGELVLAEACEEAASWPGGLQAPVLRVNMAAEQVCDEDELILKRVADVLVSTGLPVSRLCLEVTESALIIDLDQAVRVLNQFRRSGVRLSLDDFGTGYSSLSYLKRLAVDSLKIDKSFVNDLATDNESVTFINSILSLASALNLDVVAEGVENQDQVEILAGLGCKRAQGYFFHKPMPASEFRALLVQQESNN
ncbi:MAG: EAL domain-containing protein [Acidimicrobiaceae bacterium]|jgi:diguanylate cyclase (GGDEF)-like protein|nr:EAL domain-containing protein [Acidimicrobiaceae bacterium]MBT5581748.1 EAL domain-containing protein [Acidimicrobiaceae bacterium]MBT5849236.1 EAL domain-containing protein [Acidimicrobiaceae bacterium]